MRILIFLLITFLLTQPSFSQKPPVRSQPPSRAEMNSKMQEITNNIKKQIADLEKQIITAKKENPEEVKGLEEQLAMSKQQLAMIEGVNKGVSNMPEKTIQQAAKAEKDYNSIPKRDVSRINSLPKKILTEAELAVFVKKLYAEVERILPDSTKTKAMQLLSEVKTNVKEPVSQGNLAAECYIVGGTSMALYLMGKACLENMENTDNLNNYAAMLTMKGGEHAAIPILENLNRKFPRNSTILNNLGQAWFGLGDMNNANRYFDSAVVLYPRQSQANMTESEIQESEGKKAEAIESVKRAIEELYTYEKEDRVKKLGGKVKDNEIAFKYPKPWPALGIEKFIIAIPPYPMSADDAESNNNLWQDYRENLRSARSTLSHEIEQLKIKFKEYEFKKIDNPSLLLPYNNTIHNTATRKMRNLDDWAAEQLQRLYKKRQVLELDSMPKWTKEYRQATIDVSCPGLTGLSVEYMVKANTAWREMNNEILTFYKEWINTKVHYLMYANSGLPDYELQLAAAKNMFLDVLYEQAYVFGTVCKENEPGLGRRGVMPDFDEVNCQYKTELDMYFTKINVECNKMTTTIEVGPFKGSLNENLATGKFSGRAEIDQGLGSNTIGQGPLKAEASLSGKVGVEFTQDGVQDVYVEGTAGLSAGPVNVGTATARYGLISGKGSITGSGALSGINIR